jgi:thioredoxin-related protein
MDRALDDMEFAAYHFAVTMPHAAKAAAVCLALLPGLGALPAAAGRTIHDNLDSALEEARRGDKFVFLFLSADWCPACVQLEKEIIENPSEEELLRRFEFVRIDADKLERWNYRGFETTDLPTVFLLDAQGRELTRIIEYDKKPNFEESLRTFLDGGNMADLLTKRVAADPKNMDLRDFLYTYEITTGHPEAAKRVMEDVRVLPHGTGLREYQNMRFMEVTHAFNREPQDLARVIAAADAFAADFSTSSSLPSVMSHKARALWLSGKKNEAALLMRDFPARWPKSTTAYWRLIEFSRKYGVLDEEARRAIGIGRKNFSKNYGFDYFLMQCAQWFANKGDKKQARELLEAASQLSPHNDYYRYLLKRL